MRVLLIKTSSMGDLIHTLPALTDAGSAHPTIRFDWVAEDSFAEIPTLHPLVDTVIPVALRRWRKGLFAKKTNNEWRNLKQALRQREYDIVLDAQSLVKSAFLLFYTRGKRVGLDWSSARESLASLAYQKKCNVNFYQHAITRMRALFAQALDYPLPETPPQFNLVLDKLPHDNNRHPYIVFLHGTTWTTKLWPEAYWIELARYIIASGLRIKMSGGNDAEIARAKRIASATNKHMVDVLPRQSILKFAGLLSDATGVVAVDTGFAHLAAALDVPIVSLYGATNAIYTGAIGLKSHMLSADFPCAPCVKRRCDYKGPKLTAPACYASLPPKKVWHALKKSIS